MVQDDPEPAGWQRRVPHLNGALKPSFAAFRFPWCRCRGAADLVGLWGADCPARARASSPYRVRLEEDDEASWIGGTRWTDDNGFFSISVTALAGARLRIWSPRDAAYGYELIVR